MGPYLIGFIVFCTIIMTANSEIHYKIRKLECFTEPKHVYPNHSCRLKAINRYKAVAMVDAYLRGYLRNISINLALYARNDANIFRPFMVNITQNLCQLFKGGNANPYFSVFVQVLKKYSNINHTCPYSGAFIGRNQYLESGLIPFPVPKKSYKVVVAFYEGYPLEYFGSFICYIDMIESPN